MTISYQRDVASSTAGGFTRLLFKWKGSLYKLIYRELLLFISAYVLLSLIYRQVLTGTQKQLFEMVVIYFDAFLNLIPLSFVLGFYVSYVANRWWQQFLAIPWPDKLFHSIACYIEGFDEESRLLRRSLMRYMNLALILVLRSISSAVKQRFPTLDHVVEAGFMTTTEKELFSAVPANEFNTYWVPCTWFIYRIQEATRKGKLLNQYSLENIMKEFCEFRAKCGLLWCYDWVSIPMVYTQVVTIATYLFFVFTLIGRQKINDEKYGPKPREAMRSGRIPLEIDLYIPIFTILQFFFYMGLLKVAEQLINPFGDDDEDFELNWLIDRHIKASFLGCDILMNPERIPPMVKDYYWDKQDCPIPYTEASMHLKISTYRGSAADMIIPQDKCQMVLPEIEEEDEYSKGSLDLTSLLLESSNIVTGLGLGEGGKEGYLGPTPLGYERSTPTRPLPLPATPTRPPPRPATPTRPPATPTQPTPGNWRNGHPAGSRRDPLGEGQPITITDNPLLSQSRETLGEDDDNISRRGSLSERRGSKQSDLSNQQERKGKRKDNKKYRDKQGFVWRRMAPPEQEQLPHQRPPHITLEPNLYDPTPAVITPKTDTSDRLKVGNPQELEGKLKRTPSAKDPPSHHSAPPKDVPHHLPEVGADSYSPQSVRSDTSFQTCPSEPGSTSVPRKTSDVGRKKSGDGRATRPPPQMRNAADQPKPNGSVQQKTTGPLQPKPNRPKNSYAAT